MNKPIKPIKPSKNASPPSRTTRVSFKVLLNDQGEIELLPESYIEATQNDEDELDIFLEKYENVEERLKFSKILKIKQLIKGFGHDIDDFTLEQENDRDGYFNGWWVNFYANKPSEIYRKELETHHNRFEKYKRDLEQFESSMIKYNEFKKEAQRQKLINQLNNL